MDKNNLIQRLTTHIETLPVQLLHASPEKRLQRPAPGKWSAQEIVGHLCDSAMNNLKRFVEAQFLPQPYTYARYHQDNSVIQNRYQELPAEHILSLWQSLNRQVIYVIEIVPEEKYLYEVIKASGESTTLSWLITDYVDHMEHHLRQIAERI